MNNAFDFRAAQVSPAMDREFVAQITATPLLDLIVAESEVVKDSTEFKVQTKAGRVRCRECNNPVFDDGNGNYYHAHPTWKAFLPHYELIFE